MRHTNYTTDLSDVEWEILQPLIPPPRPGGRPRDMDCREILNAVFYVRGRGCGWRQLPLDLPPWQTVYGYLRLWRQGGVWKRMQIALCDAAARGAVRAATVRAALDEPPAPARQPQEIDHARSMAEQDASHTAMHMAA